MSEAPQAFLSVAIRGSALSAIGYMVSRGLTLASYIILAQVMAPAEFGRFAAGSVLIGFGMIFAESGMTAALIHRRNDLEAAFSTAVIATLLGGVAVSLLALVSAP